jgi:hypothetical protein
LLVVRVGTAGSCQEEIIRRYRSNPERCLRAASVGQPTEACLNRIQHFGGCAGSIPHQRAIVDGSLDQRTVDEGGNVVAPFRQPFRADFLCGELMPTSIEPGSVIMPGRIAV